jgi:hypothetical protein
VELKEEPEEEISKIKEEFKEELKKSRGINVEFKMESSGFNNSKWNFKVEIKKLQIN